MPNSSNAFFQLQERFTPAQGVWRKHPLTCNCGRSPCSTATLILSHEHWLLLSIYILVCDWSLAMWKFINTVLAGTKWGDLLLSRPTIFGGISKCSCGGFLVFFFKWKMNILGRNMKHSWGWESEPCKLLFGWELARNHRDGLVEMFPLPTHKASQTQLHICNMERKCWPSTERFCKYCKKWMRQRVI